MSRESWSKWWAGFAPQEKITLGCFFFLVAVIVVLFGIRLANVLCEKHPAIPPHKLPLEQLMPRFEIVTNADNTYQIRLRAYNETNWCLVNRVFSNEFDAAYVIGVSRLELEIRYSILKGMAEDLEKMGEGR